MGKTIKTNKIVRVQLRVHAVHKKSCWKIVRLRVVHTLHAHTHSSQGDPKFVPLRVPCLKENGSAPCVRTRAQFPTIIRTHPVCTSKMHASSSSSWRRTIFIQRSCPMMVRTMRNWQSKSFITHTRTRTHTLLHAWRKVLHTSSRARVLVSQRRERGDCTGPPRSAEFTRRRRHGGYGRNRLQRRLWF